MAALGAVVDVDAAAAEPDPAPDENAHS